MDILTFIIVVGLVGLVLWAINKYVPMEGYIKRILNISVAVIVVIWILKLLGFWSELKTIHV